MCNTCDLSPTEVFENWLRHHLPVEGTRNISPNQIAIDAILTYRLDMFSHQEIIDHYGIHDEVLLEEVLFSANHVLSQIEETLLSISKS